MLNPLVESFAQINRKIAPKADPAPIINITRPKLWSLQNGLTVLCIEDHKLPVVRVSLSFDRDPLFEGAKVGLTHLFGDMLASGTQKHTKEEFDEQIDQMGTSLSSYFSGVYLSSLKHYFIPSLALMSQMVLEPRFDNVQEFEKLIKQSHTQLKMSQKDPQSILSRVQKRLYYGKNHPYGEFVTSESLMRIKLEDFRVFYERYFRPEKAYLTFVGDISKEEAYELAKKYFSHWKKHPEAPLTKYKRAAAPSSIEIDLVDVPSLTQAVISVGGPVDFKKSSPDYFSAYLADKILGGGPQSRLFLNLREDKGYTYGAYSKLIARKDIGSFHASAQVRTEVTALAIKEFLKEIQNIRKPLKENELDLIKNQVSGNFILDLEDPYTSARFILEEITELLPENFYQNYLKSLQWVTPSEVTSAAKKYIPEHPRILVVGDAQKIMPLVKDMGYPIALFDHLGEPL